MRPESSEAIILNTWPVRERDKLVVFLTRDHGKKRGWAYGARGMRNRFGAALEPLAKIRVHYTEKENDEIVRIESVDLIRSLFRAQQNLAASFAASYVAELADVFAQADDPQERLYRLVDRASEALLDARPVLPVIAYVETWVLRLAGIYPSLADCAICHEPLARPLRFDEGQAAFVCPDCARRSSDIVPNSSIELLQQMVRLPIDQFSALEPPAGDLFEIRAIARSARRAFLGHELKSHDIIQTALES